MNTLSNPSHFQVFGIPMERRNSRRRLVVATYAVLAVVFAVAWSLLRVNHVMWAYAVYAALAVSMFVFGGQGRRGLVKAFLNKPPRPDSPMVEVISMQLGARPVFPDDTSLWKNDERELQRRDRAHYMAFQVLGMGWVGMLLLCSYAVHTPRWASAEIVLNLAFGLSLLGSMLMLTLPAAIILWTEPDLAGDPESIQSAGASR